MLSFSSIVLLGNFNPPIFHPEWFDRYKVLPAQEIQSAEGLNIEKEEIPYKGRKLIIQTSPPPLIVTPDVTHLSFPSLEILVQQERFECKTIYRQSFSLIKEVTFKTFSLLKHTPVLGMGFNFEGNWKYDIDSLEILKNLFGNRNDVFLETFGLSYQIGGTVNFESGNSKIRIDYKPSKILKNGVCFKVNFHRDIESKNAEDALAIINEKYDNDLAEIIQINKTLLGEPKEYKEYEQP